MNTLIPVINSMRPGQWYKNLVIFMPIIFSLNLFNMIFLFKTLLAFFVVCLAAGCAAVFDDIIDKEKDKINPIRKDRPVASETIGMNKLEFSFVAILTGVLFSSFFLNIYFGLIVVLYLIVMAVYSLWAKYIFLLDISVLALAMPLVSISGYIVVNEKISPWIIMLVFLLGFLSAVSKLKTELVMLGGDALLNRPLYNDYTKGFLNSLIAFVCISIFNIYAISSILGDTAIKVGDARLIYTIPIVVFAFFRFVFLMNKDIARPIEDSILHDVPFVFSVILWFLVTVLLIYV